MAKMFLICAPITSSQIIIFLFFLWRDKIKINLRRTTLRLTCAVLSAMNNTSACHAFKVKVKVTGSLSEKVASAPDTDKCRYKVMPSIEATCSAVSEVWSTRQRQRRCRYWLVVAAALNVSSLSRRSLDNVVECIPKPLGSVCEMPTL